MEKEHVKMCRGTKGGHHMPFLRFSGSWITVHSSLQLPISTANTLFLICCLHHSITACSNWQGINSFENTAYLVSISPFLCLTAPRESHSGVGGRWCGRFGEIQIGLVCTVRILTALLDFFFFLNLLKTRSKKMR